MPGHERCSTMVRTRAIEARGRHAMWTQHRRDAPAVLRPGVGSSEVAIARRTAPDFLLLPARHGPGGASGPAQSTNSLRDGDARPRPGAVHAPVAGEARRWVAAA